MNLRPSFSGDNVIVLESGLKSFRTLLPGRTKRVFVGLKEAGVAIEEAERHMTERMGIERFGTPEEIANLVAFLASEHSSCIQAAIIDRRWWADSHALAVPGPAMERKCRHVLYASDSRAAVEVVSAFGDDVPRRRVPDDPLQLLLVHAGGP
jgi:hypothetical protein